MTTPASSAMPLRPASASAAIPKKKAKRYISWSISLGFAVAALGLASVGLILVPSFTNPKFLANLGVVGLIVIFLALAWLTVDNERIKPRTIRAVLLVVFAALLVLAIKLDWIAQFDWAAAGLGAATIAILVVEAFLFELRRWLKR